MEAHHDRPDGRGYGKQVTRGEIPLGSRILAVANAYWTLRAERPHREPLSAAEVVKIIGAGAGTQYDAEVAARLPAALSAGEGGGEPARGPAASERDPSQPDYA